MVLFRNQINLIKKPINLSIRLPNLQVFKIITYMSIKNNK